MSEEDIPFELRKALGFRKSERINKLVLDVVSNSGNQIAMSGETEKAFPSCAILCMILFITEPCAKQRMTKPAQLSKGCISIMLKMFAKCRKYLFVLQTVRAQTELFATTLPA